MRFSRSFLQSLAMLSGPAAPTSVGPFARGTLTAIAPLSPGSSLLLATVSWADGVTTQVNVANLERQPGNPAVRSLISRLTPESIRASQADLPPIGTVITELRRQDHLIQQEQHRYRSPRGFQHWANHLAYAALIEAGAEVMNELADPIGCDDPGNPRSSSGPRTTTCATAMPSAPPCSRLTGCGRSMGW